MKQVAVSAMENFMAANKSQKIIINRIANKTAASVRSRLGLPAVFAKPSFLAGGNARMRTTIAARLHAPAIKKPAKIVVSSEMALARRESATISAIAP